MEEVVRRFCPCVKRCFSKEKPPDPPEDPGKPGVRKKPPSDPPQPASVFIYSALFSYQSRQPEELSFRQGDLFKVSSRTGDWWTAQRIDRNGRVMATGTVPYNYLQRAEELDLQPWFFGVMSRFEAQNHLMLPENEDGAFLIRQSEKENIGYVLSVRSGVKTKHFKIYNPSSSSFYVEAERSFSSVIDLVENYSCNHAHNIRLGSSCKRLVTEKKPPPAGDFPEDEWELPKDDFTLGEKLGSGYFSEVYRGRWKNHINVAVKILKNDASMNTEFQKEVHVLKSLRHRHLISLFAVCTSSPPYYIITELMERGSLLNVLRLGGDSLDMGALVDMAAQVADGMSYLEEMNSIHRDLAARNVLVGEDFLCKVADFGLARIIKEPFYMAQDKKIPYKWSAPEAISHGKFSSKSDVWSFGVLFYEIMTGGSIPYPALNHQEMYEKLIEGYRMPKPPKCNDNLYKLMRSCWLIQPDDRPDFKTIKVSLESHIYDLDPSTITDATQDCLSPPGGSNGSDSE